MLVAILIFLVIISIELAVVMWFHVKPRKVVDKKWPNPLTTPLDIVEDDENVVVLTDQREEQWRLENLENPNEED